MLKALLLLTALALVQARPGEELVQVDDRNSPCATTTTGPGCDPVPAPTIPPPTNDDDCETLENGCPADWHVHKLLPHEEYCHKFYYCDKGELVERYCAPGTYFNYEIQVCDWPYNVDCVNDGSYEYPSTSEPEVNPPIGDVLDNGCPSDFSIHHLLPHESECDKFYYCVFGEKVERTCAKGTHFNFEIQVCDWPQNAGCEFYVPPPTNPCDATTAGPGGCNPAPETTPSATTTTTTGNPSPCDATTAGPGGCNPDPTTPAATATPPTAPCDSTTAGPGGCGTLPNNCPADFDIHWLLPHESDCSKFYYCVRGELVERDCAPGTHFNPTLQVCDWPQDAGCEFYVPPVTNPCDATTAGPGGCNPEVTVTAAPTTAAPTTPAATATPPTAPCDSTTAGPGGCGTLPNNCPADFDIHWLLPHESDCSKFYYCVWGELVERDCAPGTHFNPTLQVCDWPQDAGCEFYVPPVTNPCDATTAGPGGCNPEVTVTAAPTTAAPTTPAATATPPTAPCDSTTAGPGGCGTLPNNCPADFDIHWLLPHESDCSKFYYCVWGELVERDCAPGTHFNPTLQVCDWPQDAGCEFYVPPVTNPCDATTAGPGGCNPEVTVTAAPTTAAPTTPAATATPPTAPCDSTTAGPGGCGTLPNNCPADFDIHWLLPHESDCSKFYYCVWGELVERDCAPGTHFNPTLQVCDWPQNAGCEFYEPPVTNPCDATTAGPGGCNPEVTVTAAPTTAAPTTPAATATPPTAPCDSTTAGPGGCGTLPNNCPADFDIHWLLPHESDCSKFYYCVFGELVERDCAPGTHFNPTLQVCDWPQNAGCEFYEPPVTNPCDATTAGPGGCNPEVTVTAAPTTAAPTTPAATATPPTAPCDSTTAGPGGCGTLPNNCPADFDIHWLLPHESDCSKFYYCVWGELVERDCAPGTHFNPTLQVCDWPQYAGCEFYEPPVTNPCDATTAGPGGCNPEPETTPSATTTTTTGNPSPCDATTAGPGGCEPVPEPTTTVGTTTTTSTPAPCTSTPGPGGCIPDVEDRCVNECNVAPWAHDTDCDKYWICNGQQSVLIACSEGLHFNPSTNTCDFICNAGCVRGSVQATEHADGVSVFLPWDKVDSDMAKLLNLA